MKKAKKSLSQNFLTDKNICNKILKLVDLRDRIIVEIGPGYGFMTDFILEKNPRNLILIEKDINLVKILKDKYKDKNNVVVLEKDILKFKFKEFKRLIIVSNLPYNISTKVILYLFENNKYISEMILMIQKEVAQKFDYNLAKMNKYKFFTKLLSIYLRCFDVSPKVFKPIPKVTSSVVKFKFRYDEFNLEKAHIFSKLIFKNVRKKIHNNLNLTNNKLLLNKRVNEITIDELLSIYNLF